MKRARGSKIGIIIFLLAVLGLAAYFGIRSLPEPGAALPLTGVQINLLSPASGLQVTPGDGLLTAALMLTDGSITRVELWADGQLVEARDYMSGVPTPHLEDWTWLAGPPGPHVLVVRAKNNAGQIGQSAPVVVNVMYAPPAAPYTTRKGESIESIASKFSLPPATLEAANPGIDPTSPLPAGQQINLPSAPESPTTPPPPAGQEPGNPPGKLAIAFSEITGMITGGFPPSTPKLAIGAQGCQVKLVITPGSDTALGYTIFGLQLAAQNYVKLADIGPGQDPLAPIAWVDSQPFLTNMQYFVTAFNAAGSSASNFVSLEGAANAMGANGCFSDDGNGQAGVTELPVLVAEFSATTPVEQSYCYFSNNGSDWLRYPDSDFQFFQEGPLTGLEKYLQSGNAQAQFQAQCWGWQGGELNYLGYASVIFPPNPANPTFVMSGESFDLKFSTGFPNNLAETQPILPAWVGKKIPHPFNLRPAVTTDLCEAHGGYKVSPSPCNQIGLVPKQYEVLVWDWSPKTCWPGTDCEWYNQIDGFNVYTVNNMKVGTLLTSVPAGTTAVAVPQTWAGYLECYTVRAYSNASGNMQQSDFAAAYCPGDTQNIKTKMVPPSHIITTADLWENGDDCGAYNDAKNLGGGQMLVGVYDGSYDDCDWDQRHYDGAVRFDLANAFPLSVDKISVQRAWLHFKQGETDYSKSQGNTPLCATDLGFERLSWESWAPATAAAGKTDMLSWGNNASPYRSLSPYGSTSVDVTGAVIYWLKNLSLNHGFVLWTDTNDVKNLGLNPSSSIYYCFGKLYDFQLEIQYYTLP